MWEVFFQFWYGAEICNHRRDLSENLLCESLPARLCNEAHVLRDQPGHTVNYEKDQVTTVHSYETPSDILSEIGYNGRNIRFVYFWFAGILKTESSTATLSFMSVNLRVAGLNTSTSEVRIVKGSFTPPTSL